MDYYLPKLSGIELTHNIRSTEGINKKTPIIAFTGDAYNVDDIIKNHVMEDCLMKPINEQQLIEILNKWLRD